MNTLNNRDSDLYPFLLLSVCDWTDGDLEFFLANRDELTRVAKTPEYSYAKVEDIRARRMIAGAAIEISLDDHIIHASGRKKTVCTSAVIGYFGIPSSTYHYSGHSEDLIRILNRNGWSVRSRKSHLGVKPRSSSYPTLNQARRSIRELGESGHYALTVTKGKQRHLILLDSQADVIVDTAESMTAKGCRVENAFFVERI